MNPQELLADAIYDQLDRLRVSTNQEPSWLICGYRDLLGEGSPNTVVVEIYDYERSANYDGRKVLDFLRGVTSATLEPESPENIWKLIRAFGV